MARGHSRGEGPGHSPPHGPIIREHWGTGPLLTPSLASFLLLTFSILLALRLPLSFSISTFVSVVLGRGFRKIASLPTPTPSFVLHIILVDPGTGGLHSMHFVGGPSATHSEGEFEGVHSMALNVPLFLFHLLGRAALEAADGASWPLAELRCPVVRLVPPLPVAAAASACSAENWYWGPVMMEALPHCSHCTECSGCR